MNLVFTIETRNCQSNLKKTLLLGPRHGKNYKEPEEYTNTVENTSSHGLKSSSNQEVFKCHIGNCSYQASDEQYLEKHIKGNLQMVI